ncbi:unnamed protein product [Coffea canephora]|uniref:NmrA-like domain-containing protein n=1 Tax=Coffea canephora TaxID=49390 RepID=A0A068V3G4_COFCA|nr:unnamed protein product [Coffea canephora]
MPEKSKILIIGGTGYIGEFIVEASTKAGHPTFVLVRESTVSDPVKGKLVEGFKNSGSTLVHGDLYCIIMKRKIIDAIKEAGNVKRFYPSEFGVDVDRQNAVEPAKSAFAGKSQIRRATEAAGIPYTYLPSNAFAGYFLPTLLQPGATAPPRDKVVILGDRNAKAVFNEEHDIGTFTIKTVDDPKALNKVVYIRPPKNSVSFNELVAIWEKKIGKTLEKEYIPEEQLLKNIQGDKKFDFNFLKSLLYELLAYEFLMDHFFAEAPIPLNHILSLNHAILVNGDTTNFAIEPSLV